MGLYKTKPTWRAKIAQKLRKKKGKLWKDIASRILKPRQNLPEVNVGHINKHTKDGEVVVVPGKVLGVGTIDHKVIVAALSFSDAAKRKITEAKGRCLTLEELANENPDGSNIRILG